MLLKGNRPPKMYSYGNIFPKNSGFKKNSYIYISKKFIFGFQLVPFALSLISRDPLMVSPPPLKYGEGGLFLKKKNIHWGTNFGKQNYGGIVLHGETIMIRFS